MATLDDIFTSSNLDESKKKAKMYFGRILINLRKTNHIKLYSLLESVEDQDIVDGKLIFTLQDKVAYDMINNDGDKQVLNDIVKILDSTLAVELKCSGKEPLDVYKLTSRLKEEFGKILTIKN